MINKLILSACLLLSLVTFAQDGTSSPYSFYGIGDIRFKGALENRSMGGVAVEPDSIHVNLQNPANIANLKLTAYTLGVTYGTTQLKTSELSDNASRGTLDYLAVGIPIGKFGASFGLTPYTSVGYKIRSINSDITQSNFNLSGSGGVNKVFLGLGYSFSPNFSVGADVHYNFGSTKTDRVEYIYNVVYGTQVLSDTKVSGVNFNVGMMYHIKFNDKLTFYSSLNVTPESSFDSENKRVVQSGSYSSAGIFIVNDQLDEQVYNNDLKFSTRWAAGLAIGQSKKWLVGTDFAFHTADDITKVNLGSVNYAYGKYGRCSIGGYYIPDYNSFSNYAKKVTYRGGFRYEKTGLWVNSEPINDMALTLGAGFPMAGSFSNVNIGFEFGKKGTTDAGLIQENYANVSMSLSLNDKWFVRRKFN